MYVIDSYTVRHGRYRGRAVCIGLPIPPDFPAVAPYGMHVRNDHGFEGGVQSVSQSGLGPEWSFWSRKLQWNGNDPDAPERYMEHVDRWLELV